MSKMRISKGAKLGDYRPSQPQVTQKKPKKSSNQRRGFKLDFGSERISYQQQQEPELHAQQDTPINILQINTSSQDAVPRVDHNIRTVNSQIVVPEDADNEFPFNASVASIQKSSSKENKDKDQSLILEKNWAKEEQLTQSLFIRLIQQSDQSFLQILKNQAQQSYPCQNIYSFFCFREIMTSIALKYRNSSSQQAKTQLQQLNKYISKQILKLGKQRCQDLKIQSFPEIFLIFITQTHQRYINILLKANNIQRALAIANFQDKSFISFPSRYATSNFQFQLTCIREKQLDILKNSVWLLELGVVTSIFKSNNIYDYGQTIIQRQIQFQDHILPSQFLVFCLQWNRLSKQKRLENSSLYKFKDQDIQNLIKFILQTEYYELWQFFITLKPQLSKYPKAFKMVLENLIRKLKRPYSFLQIISFSQINPNQIAPYFNLYISQNKSIKKNPSLIDDLKKCISEGLTQNKTSNVALKLTEWVDFTQLKKLYEKGHIEQYLTKMLKNYEKLQKSDFVKLDELLNMMIQSITDFKICCNYKFSKRKQIYQILGELQKKLPQSQKKYLDIIEGCISFIQLRQSIFQLEEQGKIRSIQNLYNYLQQQAKRLEKSNDQNRSQNVKKVIRILKDALLKMLQTNAGKIYLSKLCKQMKKQKEAILLPGGVDMLLNSKETNFSILMEVLGQNNKILNQMAILLGFS